MNVSGVIFFPLEPKKQRSKKKIIKKITPDLKLGGRVCVNGSVVGIKTQIKMVNS